MSEQIGDLTSALECACSQASANVVDVMMRYKGWWSVLNMLNRDMSMTEFDPFQSNGYLDSTKMLNSTEVYAHSEVCWTTVYRIKVGDFAPISIPNFCDSKSQALDFSDPSCSDVRFKGKVNRLGVAFHYGLCERIGLQAYVTGIYVDIHKNYIKKIYRGLVDALYSDIIVNGSLVSYEKFSNTGDFIDASATGLTYDVVSSLVETNVYDSGELASDLYLFVDSEGRKEYEESLATKYPNCCFLFTDPLADQLIRDKKTGINIVVLPKEFFKLDQNNKPIYVLVNSNYFSYRVGVPQALKMAFGAIDGYKSPCYDVKVLSANSMLENGGMGSSVPMLLERTAHGDIRTLPCIYKDFWYFDVSQKLDKLGFSFILGKVRTVVTKSNPVQQVGTVGTVAGTATKSK